jgi:hypothetical protein
MTIHPPQDVVVVRPLSTRKRKDCSRLLRATKFEIRSTKFETSPKRPPHGVLDLGHSCFEFVSDLVLWIWDFKAERWLDTQAASGEWKNMESASFHLPLATCHLPLRQPTVRPHRTTD